MNYPTPSHRVQILYTNFSAPYSPRFIILSPSITPKGTETKISALLQHRAQPHIPSNPSPTLNFCVLYSPALPFPSAHPSTIAICSVVFHAKARSLSSGMYGIGRTFANVIGVRVTSVYASTNSTLTCGARRVEISSLTGRVVVTYPPSGSMASKGIYN